MLFRQALASLLIFMAAGCMVYTNHGLYESAPVEGWLLYEGEGAFRFLSPKYKEGRGLLFSTRTKGELYLNVYFPTEGAVKFDEPKLRIVPHDGGAPRSVPILISMMIQVPDTSDFTVEFPPFAVGGEQMPPFAARFKWSDRTYRIIQVGQ